MVGDAGYRLRDLLLFGGGLMAVGSYIGTGVSGWAPWVVAAVAGASVGAIVREGNDGAGAGALAAGLGGFVFTFASLGGPAVVDGLGDPAVFDESVAYLVDLVPRLVTVAALFALVGLFAGGVAGYVRGWLRRKADEVRPAAEDAGGE